MSGVAEPGHTGQQQPENCSHQGQYPARVRSFRFTKQVDRVGNRLHPGQRRTAVGERPQDHQDRRPHHQAVALLDRHDAVHVLRVVCRQIPQHFTSYADHDHQREHADKPVRRHRERPARLPQSAQVRVTEDEHRTDRDFQAVGAQHRYRRGHGHGARRALDRHGDHVVDQQRCRCDLGYAGAEVLPGHDVGAPGPGVGHHNLPIRRGDQQQNQQDHADQRKQQHKRGHPRSGQQLDHDLLGAVCGRGDRIR